MSSKTKTTATKEEATPALVPKLRFPEFRNAEGWTTETLGSVAKISTEKVGKNTCIPMSITSGVGLVSQMEKFGRIIAGSSYANYLLLKKNDFAYNKSATKEYPEGFIALYSGDELAAVPNSIFTCFRIKGDSPVPQYLNYLLLGNLHGRWLRNFIEVGARAHGSLSIDEDDLLALPVPLPSGKTSLHEQQKIAECLSSVDELIAAQARKLDALKTHKKGLMQQLFPREGETQPRLRFPEFQNAGEWSQKPLGGLCRIRTGKKDANEGAADGAYPFFTCAERHIYSHSYSFDAEAILIAGNANVGQTNYYNGKFEAYQRTYVLTEFSDIFVPYLYSVLNANLRPDLLAQVQTSAMSYIRLPMLEEYRINAPTSQAEQQRIATCLSSLDALITAEAQKHEALKTHKKGLMQQLFPSPEEVEG
ncbi:MAG: restriction endonuclease subunit S [Verrucomicrobiota bacterium]